ncbi:UNKNOWN [Stylonychia lemnae]|uniref:Uncharacterized protein n=1 Tax=Stylonychia lemnae TaxID=5949 RepID=A0A078AXZ2_STYLE|nr:UNKNOWN [Stylonychia lemnae]|eukprot:CDW86097.1 UNKNOWN [Stylonychia lemnae]
MVVLSAQDNCMLAQLFKASASFLADQYNNDKNSSRSPVKNSQGKSSLLDQCNIMAQNQQLKAQAKASKQMQPKISSNYSIQNLHHQPQNQNSQISKANQSLNRITSQKANLEKTTSTKALNHHIGQKKSLNKTFQNNNENLYNHHTQSMKHLQENLNSTQVRQESKGIKFQEESMRNITLGTNKSNKQLLQSVENLQFMDLNTSAIQMHNDNQQSKQGNMENSYALRQSNSSLDILRQSQSSSIAMKFIERALERERSKGVPSYSKENANDYVPRKQENETLSKQSQKIQELSIVNEKLKQMKDKIRQEKKQEILMKLNPSVYLDQQLSNLSQSFEQINKQMKDQIIKQIIHEDENEILDTEPSQPPPSLKNSLSTLEHTNVSLVNDQSKIKVPLSIKSQSKKVLSTVQSSKQFKPHPNLNVSSDGIHKQYVDNQKIQKVPTRSTSQMNHIDKQQQDKQKEQQRVQVDNLKQPSKSTTKQVQPEMNCQSLNKIQAKEERRRKTSSRQSRSFTQQELQLITQNIDYTNSIIDINNSLQQQITIDENDTINLRKTQENIQMQNLAQSISPKKQVSFKSLEIYQDGLKTKLRTVTEKMIRYMKEINFTTIIDFKRQDDNPSKSCFRAARCLCLLISSFCDDSQVSKVSFQANLEDFTDWKQIKQYINKNSHKIVYSISTIKLKCDRKQYCFDQIKKIYNEIFLMMDEQITATSPKIRNQQYKPVFCFVFFTINYILILQKLDEIQRGNLNQTAPEQIYDTFTPSKSILEDHQTQANMNKSYQSSQVATKRNSIEPIIPDKSKLNSTIDYHSKSQSRLITNKNIKCSTAHAYGNKTASKFSEKHSNFSSAIQSNRSNINLRQSNPQNQIIKAESRQSILDFDGIQIKVNPKEVQKVHQKTKQIIVNSQQLSQNINSVKVEPIVSKNQKFIREITPENITCDNTIQQTVRNNFRQELSFSQMSQQLAQKDTQDQKIPHHVVVPPLNLGKPAFSLKLNRIIPEDDIQINQAMIITPKILDPAQQNQNELLKPSLQPQIMEKSSSHSASMMQKGLNLKMNEQDKRTMIQSLIENRRKSQERKSGGQLEENTWKIINQLSQSIIVPNSADKQ